MYSLWPIVFILIGCCYNTYFLELILSEIPTCTNLITLAQFLFISIEGYIFTTNFSRRPRQIPIYCYVKLVSLHSLIVICQSILHHMQIDMPLIQLLRSSSLVGTLILGKILLKKNYHFYKYLSVAMISLGITIATISSAYIMKRKERKDITIESNVVYINWIIGITAFFILLLATAFLGIQQEITYNTYGKHEREALFYCHILPLPLFSFLSKDLFNQLTLFNQSKLIPLYRYSSVQLPIQWIYLLANVITHYVCIRGVYAMTSHYTCLTVTMFVTLRKFISLLLSVIYFDNAFTVYHWMATVLVFCGALLYLDSISQTVTYCLKRLRGLFGNGGGADRRLRLGNSGGEGGRVEIGGNSDLKKDL